MPKKIQKGITSKDAKANAKSSTKKSTTKSTSRSASRGAGRGDDKNTTKKSQTVKSEKTSKAGKSLSKKSHKITSKNFRKKPQKRTHEKASARKRSHFFSLYEINHIVRTLILSEVIVVSAFGLTAPIFAVYVLDNLTNVATIETVAIATTVYLMTRALTQVFIGMYIDRVRGERDELIAMIFGTALIALVPLMYIGITSPGELYFVQFFYGISSGIVFPAWMATFTRHVDKKHEGLEWGVYRSFIDMGTAIAALVGGYLAVKFGFELVFILISAITFLAALHLLVLRAHFVRREGDLRLAVKHKGK